MHENISNFTFNMKIEKFIDIEKIVESKSPKAKKWIPWFVFRYLKRILHQKEINKFLTENKGVKDLEFCENVVKYRDVKVTVKNLERVPKEGKIVIAMNHPLGGMDAMILVSALKGHREDLKFIVNDILMNLKNLEGLFVGINKHGKNENSLRGQIDNLFKSDEAICIFPAGLVSRRTKGVIKDSNWKKTFVTYSRKYDRTIIPIYIDGGLSNWFYRLSNFRKFFGIKMNLEMLYLADETYKQKGKHLKFIVGKPITKEFIDEHPNDNKLAQEIKNIVYELKNEV